MNHVYVCRCIISCAHVYMDCAYEKVGGAGRDKINNNAATGKKFLLSVELEKSGMEGQEGCSDAALARERLLTAALPTAEHVNVQQPSLAGTQQPLASDANPAVPAGIVNTVRQPLDSTADARYESFLPAPYSCLLRMKKEDVVVCII